MTYISNSASETEAIGERLAGELQPGSVIAFIGGLGMGKTALTRGLARGLGITMPITSPTYTIVNEYEGRLPLFHFDLYRLNSMEDLEDIGLDDYLDRGGICCFEWSENAPEIQREAICITIARGETDEQRVINIEGVNLRANPGV